MDSHAPRCEACGMPMILGQKRRHAVCDPNSIMGRACRCRERCSTAIVGGGPTPCDPDCVVCRVLQGQPYTGYRRR